MRKFNFFCSILIVITLPLMIVSLSSNLVLRVSETYNYHFNDSVVLNEISYSIKNDEMASAITHSISPFNSDGIQVYEDNGDYKDPVFTAEEQKVMKKVKNVLNIALLLSLLLLCVTVTIYVYFVKYRYTMALRKRYWFASGFTLLLLLAQGICLSTKSFRVWLYNLLIGIDLPKSSTLAIVLGDPFFKTFILISSVFVIIFLGVLTYVNTKFTKPERIFY